MNIITRCLEYTEFYLSETFSTSHQREVGEGETHVGMYISVTGAVLIAAISAYAVKKILVPKNIPLEESSESFWEELEKHQRPPLPIGPVVISGRTLAKDLHTYQKRMFDSCTNMSSIFEEHLAIHGLYPQDVIDLGCKRGAQSIPLLECGFTVTAIDSMQEMIDLYRSQVNEKDQELLTLKCADLTTLDSYAKENTADIVLAIDTLPYIPISCWKSTMEKISAALKPGGYFIGTIFTKEEGNERSFITLHERSGAQYYTIPKLAERLMFHSGLIMIKCRLRSGNLGCYEFIAYKICHIEL